jgi:hypothetical protein
MVMNKSVLLRKLKSGLIQIFILIGMVSMGAVEVHAFQFTENTSTLIDVRRSTSAWGDYDNDGDLDLAVSGYNGSTGVIRLYKNNNNGTFTIDEDPFLTILSVHFASLAWGDYDNDGDLDLVVSGRQNSGDAPSTFLYENTNGTFGVNSSVSNILTNVQYSALAWGDYDNDGDLDLVVSGTTNTNNTGAITTLYKNDGNGGFTDSGISLPNVYWSSIKWGDYNNDGFLDLAIAGINDSNNRITTVYKNNGSGGFSNSGATIDGISEGHIDWGDYDNDGDLDLAISGYTVSATRITKVFENTGSDVFAVDAGLSLTGVRNSALSWNDYDSDGDLDLLVTGTTTSSQNEALTKLYVNDGSGGLSDSGFSLPNVAYGALSFGDYDNDGDADLVLSGLNSAGNLTAVYENTGLGISAPSTPQNLASEINATKDTLTLSWDYVDTNFDSAYSYNVFISDTDNSDGSTDSLGAPMADLASGFRLVAEAGNAGIDNEYKIAINNLPIGEEYNWGVQTVNSNSKASAFTTSTFIRPGFKEDIALTGAYWSSSDWGDYDNDGDLDFVVAGFENPGINTRLYTNNGDGTFTSEATTFRGLIHSAVAWGDYNNDGYLDLVITGGEDGSSYFSELYTNDKNGTFALDASATSLFEGVLFGDVVWGDIDNDLDLDLVISGETSTGQITQVYNNNGDGTFSTGQSLTAVEQSSLSFGDYDKDGDLDLMVTGTTNGSNSGSYGELYQNTNGTFTEVNVSLDSNRKVINGETAWGDYDNDGDLDLVITGEVGSSKATNLYQNTIGSFSQVTSVSNTLINVENSSVAFGDYDGDSDLDLIVSGLSNSGRVTRLYENNAGSFSTNNEHNFEISGAGSLIWVDYNNDGKLDLSQTGYGVTGGITKLYKNTITTTSGPGSITGLTAEFNASVNPDSIIFSWTKLTDANNNNASIDYNLYLVNVTNPDTLIAGLADTTTGFRRTLASGNVGIDTDSFGFKIPDNFSFGDTYRVGVQAIDLSLRATSFSSKTIKFNDGFIQDTSLAFFNEFSETTAAWGDYDNDGDLDLVFSGLDGTNSPITLFLSNLNDGASWFSFPDNSPISTHFHSLAFGDYDNDGDLDLAGAGVDNQGNQITKIYKNDGNGVLSEEVFGIIGVSKSAIDWGDYDNDGDLDLLISGTTDGSVSGATTSLYENRDGFSESNKISLTGLFAGTVSFGDYDNDDDLDLAISGTNSSSQAVTKIYENNGEGNFQEIKTIANYDASLWGISTDQSKLNLTIWESDFDYKEQVLVHNGADDFIASIQPPVDGFGGPLSWIDYDSDGDMDLLSSQSSDQTASTSQLKMYINDGSDNFNSSFFITNEVNDLRSIFLSDFNNDGSVDFIVSGSDTTIAYKNYPKDSGNEPGKPGIISTSLNVNTDTLTISWGAATDLDGGSLSYNVFIADVNDENADTLGAPMANGATGYRLIPAMGNAGLNTEYKIDVNAIPVGSYEIGVQAIDGSFKSSAFTTESFTKNAFVENTATSAIFEDVDLASLAWGDYDNDGDLDIVISGSNGNDPSTKLYVNNGDGSFAENNAASLALTDLQQGSLAWGDYDNDGDLDLVLSGFDGSARITKVFANDGGFNSVNVTDLTGVTLSAVAWGDYDNDGDLDLVVSGNTGISSRITKVYENDRGFSELNSSSLVGMESSSAAWGDYDTDGDLDLVVSGFNGSNRVTSVYENDSGFSNANTINLTGVRTKSVAWGDYDNDGDLDLVVSGSTGSGSSITKVYENVGGFSDANATDLTGAQDGSIWGDYDNDGDLDLVVSGLTGSEETTRIYTNDGGFNETNVTNLAGVKNSAMAWGDYDNDGDLDLLVTGNDGVTQLISLYENFPTNSGSAPSTPSNLTTQINASRDSLTLSWDAPNDTDGGSLNYNVFLVNTDVSDTVNASMADHTNGFRRVPLPGNAGLNTEYKIGLLNHPVGTYTWGVQAIDGSLKSSAFATSNDPELIFSPVVFTITDTSFVLYKGETNTLEDELFTISDFYADSTVYISSTSPASGSIFLDVNNDSTKGEGEKFLTESGIEYPFPEGAKLRINNPTSYGLDTIKVYLSGTVNENVKPDSVQFNFGIFEGTPTIQGNENDNGWYLLANPFTTTIGELLANVWTQGAVNSDAPTGGTTLYRFNEQTGAYAPITGDIDADTLDPGEGLLAFIFEDDTPTDNAEVNGGWPKTLTNFGNPFGESVTIPIKTIDGDGSGNTNSFEGLKLFGNPFGWELSIDSLITELVNIDPLTNRYVYSWDPVNKYYVLKSSGAIEPYESVFIRTVSFGLNNEISLEYDDIYETTPTKTVVDEPFQIVLNHKDTEVKSRSSIQFSEKEALAGIDPFDGYYLGSYASKYANLYTQIGDQNLTINNLPADLDEIIEFPMYLDATVMGDFDLEWNKELLPKGWEFTLEEVSTGMIIDLNKQDGFSFSRGVSAKEEVADSLNQQDKEEEEEGTDELTPKDSRLGGEEVKATSEQLLTEIRTQTSPETGIRSKSGSTTVADPLFVLTINPLVSTSLENDLDIPTEVELHQNYPNPFNPTSIIRFGVPNTAKVRLEVFDILGRKVMTLINNETKQAGRYNVQIDARNLASGMYIYRLLIGDKAITKKMILIK